MYTFLTFLIISLIFLRKDIHLKFRKWRLKDIRQHQNEDIKNIHFPNEQTKHYLNNDICLELKDNVVKLYDPESQDSINISYHYNRKNEVITFKNILIYLYINKEFTIPSSSIYIGDGENYYKIPCCYSKDV